MSESMSESTTELMSELMNELTMAVMNLLESAKTLSLASRDRSPKAERAVLLICRRSAGAEHTLHQGTRAR